MLRLPLYGTNTTVSEFTVAPQVNPLEGLPYHEWFIEFESEPKNLDDLASKIDASMQEQNIYWRISENPNNKEKSNYSSSNAANNIGKSDKKNFNS